MGEQPAGNHGALSLPNQAAFLITLDGAIVGWGPGAQALFGYTAGELTGRSVLDLVPADTSSEFRRLLSAVSRGEQVEVSETMLGKDGARLDVSLHVSPARNGSSRVTGARVVARDITQERAEEGRAWLSALLDSLHDAAYLVDRSGVIRGWNPAAERQFGYAPYEALGLPALSLAPDRRHDEARMALECSLAGEPVELFETELRRRDGVPVPAWMTLWPVRDRSGAVIGVSVIARDLSEERLVQAALTEAEVRLRESESLARIGSWVWDVATGAVQWSAELHRIHGIDPAGFAGTIDAHLELAHPEDRERVRATMAASVAASAAFEAEYRIVRPNGEVRRLQARAEVALAPSDSVTVAGLRGICQDVTERGAADQGGTP